MKKLLITLVSCLCCISASHANVQIFDFEDDDLGNLDKNIWKATWMADSDQQVLFQIEDGIGYQGSRGMTLDVDTARAMYRVVNQTALVGNKHTVSAKFKIELNGKSVEAANLPLFGVYFDSSPNWYDGSRMDIMLVRRRNQNGVPMGALGVTSLISKGAPSGFIDMESLGMSGQLTDASESTESIWFTLQLTLESTSEGLWNIYFYILNEKGDSIESLGAQGVELDESFDPTKPMYGGVTTGWYESNSYKVLEEGGVNSLSVDDFTIETVK